MTATTPPIGRRLVGAISWHELHTRDRRAALDFYTRLIGWTTDPASDPTSAPYTEWVAASGVHVGGSMDMPPGVPAEVPANWAIYVNVEDVEATARRVTELGGRLLAPPKDVPDVGRLCAIADPTASVIHLFQGVGTCGVEQPDAGPGQFCWNELLSHDPPKAIAFYTELLGWTTSTMPMEHGSYTIFWRPGADPASKDGGVGGVMEIDPAWGPMPSCWLSYIQVADVDATAARIARLGGMLHCPPTDIPNIGRFAIGGDPTGAMFALFMPK